MALIHTIAIENEKASGSTVSSTRKSDSKKYLACVVATTTERSLTWRASERARLTAKLDAEKAALEAACAKFGMTVEEAKVKHEAESERWYNTEDGLFATAKRIQEAHGEKWLRNASELAKADLLARGFVDPFDKDGFHSICEAFSKVRNTEWNLSVIPTDPVGAQAVLTWCGTPALATKAMAQLAPVESRFTMGDDFAVRTDITITETKKRAKKDAATV